MRRSGAFVENVTRSPCEYKSSASPGQNRREMRRKSPTGWLLCCARCLLSGSSAFFYDIAVIVSEMWV